MLIFNNLWDNVNINVKTHDGFSDIINDSNYEITKESIILKPLQIIDISVTMDSILYVQSYDANRKIHRTDYLTIFSLGEVPDKMMLAHLYNDSYKCNSEEHGFNPDIVFALSYIMPSRVIVLFKVYTFLYIFIVIMVLLLSFILTLKTIKRFF
jgi:hypothetical protein